MGTAKPRSLRVDFGSGEHSKDDGWSHPVPVLTVLFGRLVVSPVLATVFYKVNKINKYGLDKSLFRSLIEIK